MSRFDAYLLEARSRGKGITEDTARELIGKHCKQAVSAFKSRISNRIYRGVNKTDSFISIDPTKGIRRSTNEIPNYYTFIMSNDKSWKSYPKRARSLICTTDRVTASEFVGNSGTIYNVFFYDGAKIGVAPDIDIWDAWENSISIPVTTYLNRIMDVFNKAYGTNKIFYDKSFKQFKDACKKVDDNIETVRDDLDMSYVSVKYEGDFYKMLSKIFNSSSNGFKITTVSAIPNDSRELWSDSKAILVKTNIAPELISEVI